MLEGLLIALYVFVLATFVGFEVIAKVPQVLHTPLMWIDKAATWRLAHQLGGDTFVSLVIEDTHTCYLGERGQRYAWGHGCGSCPACGLRADGHRRYISAE